MNRNQETIETVDVRTKRFGDAGPAGVLVVNADDWGRDALNTDRTFECVLHGTVSAVSAMVFMEDSERAATIALDKRVDAGLHLNFTTPFSAAGTPTRLKEHQGRLGKYLRRNRLSQILYHPGLAGSFEYVVGAQVDEFSRLYGAAPRRLDGHHHMHLCANVLMKELLPAGTIVRRNFSFQAGEKSYANRAYRAFIDRKLAKRHSLTDYFYSLAPIESVGRLEKIFALAQQFTVEVETHPVVPDEYKFLMGDQLFHMTAGVHTADYRGN